MIRATRTHSFVVERPFPDAFELFTPEGERRWAMGWAPEYAWPMDGATEAGMVFTTRHNGEETLWTLLRHDPAAGIVEYLRVTPGSRVATVLVQCASLGPSRTRVNVTYVFTAVSEAGRAFVDGMDEATFASFIDGWGEAIARLPA